VDSENLSHDEGGDVERIAQTKQFFCICDYFLSHSYSISITYTCVFAFIALAISC